MQIPPKSKTSKLYSGISVAQYTLRNSAGYVLSRDDSKIDLEGNTEQCVHCQAMWVKRPGSGITRSWCWNCNGSTCSKKRCIEHCEPAEAFIERLEAEGNARYQAQQNARVLAR